MFSNSFWREYFFVHGIQSRGINNFSIWFAVQHQKSENWSLFFVNDGNLKFFLWHDLPDHNGATRPLARPIYRDYIANHREKSDSLGSYQWNWYNSR